MYDILNNIFAVFVGNKTAGEWMEHLHDNFIVDDRWKWLIDGLGVTLELTISSFILGLILGLIIAVIRVSHDKGSDTPKSGFKISRLIINVLDFICKIYLNVIQGTPTIIQIMIMYYAIMANSTNKVGVAIIGFTINSSAYIAEIIRGAINGVDKGQMEAGRSLGFGYVSTMFYVVIPQALKSSLPALCNELVVLLKETAVASMVAMQDLLNAALLIRSRTYNAFLPLIAAALIYLVIVSIFRAISAKLERRLNSNER